MASTPKNRIVRSPAPNTFFGDAFPVVDATISWNQGDLLYYDIVAFLIKPVTADADAATILGIAQQTILNGKPYPVYLGTQVDASAAIEALAGPVFGVEAKMKLNVGDTFTPGLPVFATAVDAQTISSAGLNPVGYFVGPLVTAVAGSEGVVKLVCHKTLDM
jgi:hypothetical protein